MISILITLEIIATAAVVYGFSQEEKIVQFENRIIKKILRR